MWGKDRLFHSSFQIIHHLFPLGVRFIGRIARGWLMPFGWIVCEWFCLFVCLFVGKTVHMNQHHRCCTFDSPGLPTIGGYPGENRGGEPMPSALYFLKSICMREIIHSLRVVRVCDEKKYNPQGGSLLACTFTQGRLRCTCQPCAIESITPMG